MPVRATAGVDGVILNSVSVSDSRAEGGDAGVVEVVVVGTVVEAVVVRGGVVEDAVLEELEELEEPEEPHAAITTAASAAHSTAMIGLKLRISCPSEDCGSTQSWVRLRLVRCLDTLTL
ncbi:MAG TPA: hypothetical protein VNR66_03560 [Solirubrobacteraceae bacterium]|nr:hypothetical protein [Solirubrobacteraceae bacterium]